MKVLCVVIIYKPEIATLQANVQSLIQNVQTVMIWQNSELNAYEKEQICSASYQHRLIFAGDGDNKGIPKAINCAIKYMKENDYDYLLTMDQDSKWVNLFDYISYVSTKEHNCIYGPQIIANTDINEVPSRAIEIKTETVNYVITSGMLCHIDAINCIGLYNEDLFIDGVDEEYCFRGRKKGILSKEVKGTYLLQHFGNSRLVSIFGRKTIIYNCSAFRYYYIVRNHMYLIRSNLPTQQEKRKICRNYIRAPLLKVLLFEHEKMKKLCAIAKGLGAGIYMKQKD